MDTLAVQDETFDQIPAGVKITNRGGIKWEIEGDMPENRPQTPVPPRLIQGRRQHKPLTCWGEKANERKQQLLQQKSEALRTLNNQIIVAQEMKREEEEAARANKKRTLAANMARAASAKASVTKERRARAANYNNDVSIKVELATMNKSSALGEEESPKRMPPRRLPPLSTGTARLELRKAEEVFAPRPLLLTEAERDILSGGSAVLDLGHEDKSETEAPMNKSLALREEENLKVNPPRGHPSLSTGTARSELRIEEDVFAPKPRLLPDAERDILNPTNNRPRISFGEKVRMLFKKGNRVGPMPQVPDSETKKDKTKKHGLWCRLKRNLCCGGH